MQESLLQIPPGPTSPPKPATSSHGRGECFPAPLDLAAAAGAGDCAEDVGDGGRRGETERKLGLKGKLKSKREGGQKDARWKKKRCVQRWLWER